jgi:hypothetical protein
MISNELILQLTVVLPMKVMHVVTASSPYLISLAPENRNAIGCISVRVVSTNSCTRREGNIRIGMSWKKKIIFGDGTV